MHGSLRASTAYMAGGQNGFPAISLGQFTQAGAKGANQDFHGSLVPEGPALVTKGIAAAVADGISTSENGARASEIAVKSFLSDYYCTPEAWTVRTSGERVIRACNSWLYSQNGRLLVDEERDRGHVCTFTALILKSRSVHFLHVGDSRLSRLTGGTLEPLTTEHRARVSSAEIYLARALGADRNLDIDYGCFPARPGDIFVLTTDGVHDSLSPAEAGRIVHQNAADLDAAAKALALRAAELGSTDDLTVQVVRVDALPEPSVDESIDEGRALPPAPLLEPGRKFEGYEILRTIHSSSRSHIYLARDSESGDRVSLKILSTELREDSGQVRRLALEEWIARRISSPHVLSAPRTARPRDHLYAVAEYVEGISLDQWMRDNPLPALEDVRRLVEQIGKGLHAFHRREMLHQDLRPQNVIIDSDGVAKIIDFGSAWIAGIAEAGIGDVAPEMLGTVQYSAPEYLLGETVDDRADIFSLGVICYQMLTGRLPFGTRRIEPGNRKALRKLRYVPARRFNPAVPDWLDAAMARAVSPDRTKRYEVVSEFLHDLRHPNQALPVPDRGPLLERRPDLWPWLLVALLAAAVAALGWQNVRLSTQLERLQPTVSRIADGAT